MFHMDVAKVDRDVAHIVMVVHVYCKHPFQMFLICFQTYVASILFGCCICFTHMLQMFYPYVAYVLQSLFKCFKVF